MDTREWFEHPDVISFQDTWADEYLAEKANHEKEESNKRVTAEG